MTYATSAAPASRSSAPVGRGRPGRGLSRVDFMELASSARRRATNEPAPQTMKSYCGSRSQVLGISGQSCPVRVL
jgi:hypothetical protein